jgi:two-component system, chemotaxis family, protein-glutamate methylesterase/glutaminase
VIKLLIADDSALVRKLLTGIFTAEGDFDIRVARNGREALELAKSFEPDVVTLDVHMPEMNGLDCLDRIMVETPRPVVMVSSLTEDGARETLQAMDLGAVDFVTKPEGAVSLEIDRLRPALVEKIRNAANAKLRRSLRLRDRVRHRIGHVAPITRPRTPREPASPRAAFQEPYHAAATEGSPEGFPGLVLIGASTGGPPAIEAVLSRLPGNFSWPILIAQHLPASFTGPFARRLDALCALEVVEVTGPAPLRPGRVYIGRGDADLIVAPRKSGPIALSAPPADYPWHPSVERLVTSALAQMPAARLIGVLMTGMGSDGSVAMTRLKSEGGRTIAEAESTAVVWGMPGELVMNGGAGVVAPLEDIADAIIEMVS